MMTRARSVVLTVFVAGMALPMAGCLVAAVGAGAAAGVGTYAYVTGKLVTTQAATLDRAFDATKGAMDDLQFTLVETKKDAISGHVRARTADDTAVNIWLKPAGDNATEIAIRVGTFGDEKTSMLILDKIKARL